MAADAFQSWCLSTSFRVNRKCLHRVLHPDLLCLTLLFVIICTLFLVTHGCYPNINHGMFAIWIGLSELLNRDYIGQPNGLNPLIIVTIDLW